MNLKMNIDSSKLKAKLDAIKNIVPQAMPAIYNEFVKNTPIRTGNARAHTNLNGKVITAAYPYAERLDDGYSNQSPDGMTQPTEEFAKKLIPQIVQQIANRRTK